MGNWSQFTSSELSRQPALVDMSSSASTSSSRKLSALTEYYDGDTESMTHSRSRLESLNIDLSRNSSLASLTLPEMLLNEPTICGDATCNLDRTSRRSILFESGTETETSTSYSSTHNYTDSEFKRVNRREDEFVESEEESKSTEGCKSADGSICNSGNVIVDSLSTMLFNSSIASVETPFANLCDHTDCEEDSKFCSSPYMLSDLSVGENELVSMTDKPQETEKEIKEKKRALRNNFREIVKDARKTLRQTRENRRLHEINPQCNKGTIKKQRERGKINNTSINSKKKDLSHKEAKMKGVAQRKRVRVVSRSDNILEKRGLEIEKIQVKHLITELAFWNLNEHAANVKRALTFTEEKEREMDIQLQEERENTRRRKIAERWNQKREEKRKRLEEIRKMEAERKEKEARDRQRRIEEAKIQRERNRMLWDSYNKVVLDNSFTRSFTFSYFPKLRPKPVERKQIEPHKITHSAKVQEAREKYAGAW